MKIDISQKVTYGQALLLPFRVTPVITVLGILNSLFKIGLVSFGVLATANFIDSAIAALQGSAAADWKAATAATAAALRLIILQNAE